MKASLRYMTVWGVCIGVIGALSSCRNKGETVRSEAPKQTPAPQQTTESPVAESPATATATSTESAEVVVFESQSEWLRAEKLRADADGGWVTGDFIPERNKIEIQTRDVTQFSINMGMLPVDWTQLVVLGIDGRNSELRQRDVDVYHIARDEKGQWIVLEP